MNENILDILKLYLQKFEAMTEGERKVIMDTLKLYIYPKYVIGSEELVERRTVK